MAWVGPAIGAGGQVAAGALGGKAAKEAGKTQLQGQREALAYQREQQAKEEARYNQALQLWNASRKVLAERYGLPLDEGIFMGSQGAPSSPGPSPGLVGPQSNAAAPASLATGGYTGAGGPMGSTLGDFLQQSPAGLEDWNNWSKYGLRQG